MSIAEKLTQVAENEPRIYDKGYAEGFESGRNVIARLIDRTITEIEIPEGVTKIGKSTFFYCLMASGTVVVPEGVWCIGQDAFNNCIGITEIKLPESLTTIEGYAFSNMKALKRLVLPSKVTSLTTAIVSNSGIEEFVALGDIVSIGVYVFHLCSKCRKYDFTACTSVPPLGGVTSFQGINAEAKILVPQSLYEEWVVATNWAEYADHIVPISSGLSFKKFTSGYEVSGIGECTDTNISIPSEYNGLPVLRIGNNAFKGNTAIESVTIPDSVTSIGETVFYNCSSLKRVSIPDSVTYVGASTFYNCKALESVTLGNGLTKISDNMFRSCNKLESIAIPDSVTSIGDYAFSYCEGLASVTIPESVTSIGKYAFGWCYKLSDVTIPDGVTSIGGHAFYCCEGITGIVIPDGVTSIATSVFSRCKRLQRITIPDTVVSISDYAFYYCEGITNVSIGSGVTKIGNSAFEGCSNVVVYDFSKCTSVPTLASASSITVNNATQIIVPDELYEAWTSATNWVRYKDYIQTESKGIVKAAPNEDNFSVYVDANTLKEIVDYNVFGKDLVQGIGESEVLYEGDVPYLRIYGDGASAEAYAFMPNTEGDTTGSYLTFAYRIPTGNSKTVDYFEVYANSTGALPTGQGDFFSIKTNHDGKWTVVAIDVKEAIATYKDVVNGTYQSQFTGNNIQHLRIDFFNQVTPTTDYIDIAYIGTCTSLALARSADPDYESATFDAVRLAQTHTKAVRNTYNGMDYVTITDTTTSGGEANTALVLSDAVLPNTANYIGVLYRNAPGGFVEFFASSDNSKWATSARSNYDTSDGWHFAIVSLNSSIFKDSVCRRLRFDYLNNLKANTKYSIDIAFAKFFSSVDEANAYYQEYATKYNV